MVTEEDRVYCVLIAEDDPDICQLLSLYLENEGYQVRIANDGEEAWALIKKEAVDFGLFDIMMPRLDGYALLKRVRKEYNFPILLLSAKDTDSDKILGLDLGADDYLTKPFNPLEVVARVRAGLRRFYRLGSTPREAKEMPLTLGRLCLFPNEMRLEKEGAAIELTPTEYKILYMLMQSPGRVYTKRQIYERIYGDSYFEGDENTLMVHISNLREKIEDNPRKPVWIKTVRGLGYKIDKTEEAGA
ncbi:MAG: response regulator transcription factor [Lachnospiraceae bacterium]|nr:response regulator transcription factor [Lachnospiraceae bacterium]